MDIAGQIKAFIVDNFMLGRAADELSNDDSLLDKGIIDSTGVLELVSFLEKDFGFTVADEELVPENLDSVNKLVNYVKRKKPN